MPEVFGSPSQAATCPGLKLGSWSGFVQVTRLLLCRCLMTSHACPKKGYFFLKERLFLLVWPSLPLAQSISGVPESLAEGERWLVIGPGHL